MMNLDAVDKATVGCLEQGIRVLHANLFAETDELHIARLLELMDPPEGAVVLDAGCGVGEVARMMKQIRPDLSFVLLNVSRAQLEECPQDMALIEADFNSMPIPDGSVDLVMFHYSICHSADWVATLREARRVLRDEGALFINDMSRDDGNNALMVPTLGAAVHHAGDVVDWAKRAGFDLQEGFFHTPVVQRLRGVFESKEFYDSLFKHVQPATWRFKPRVTSTPIADAFERHERIGFQFSGGRDSTAALFLLRPYWGRMTIYHLDTGDQFPETKEVVRMVEALTGPMVRVQGNVAGVREQFGMATDLVPVDNTPDGRLVSGREVKLIGRYECCYRSLMEPMQRRIEADRITLIVRGQRDDEYAKQPMRSGDVQRGMEVLYPIQSWSGDQVSAFLTENGLPIAPFYERGVRRAPECMGCTAWWDEGRAKYLRDYHPEAFEAYTAKMKIIRIEVDRQYGMLDG
ncbi:Ubiquinone/menaquinone biosynthesis C-methyltransferase UbiE [compost metagenome]